MKNYLDEDNIDKRVFIQIKKKKRMKQINSLLLKVFANKVLDKKQNKNSYNYT